MIQGGRLKHTRGSFSAIFVSPVLVLRRPQIRKRVEEFGTTLLFYNPSSEEPATKFLNLIVEDERTNR